MRMFGAEVLSDETVRDAVSGLVPARERVLTLIEPQVRAMVSIRIAAGPAQSEVVDEIGQQTLLALADGLSRLATTTADGLRAFVSGIVAHKVADHIRNRPNLAPAARSLDAEVGGYSSAVLLRDLLSASGLSPRSAAAHAELAARIDEALARLPADDRQVIVLAFFDQLSVSQIAERLSATRAAVSMQLMRAIHKLRERVLQSTGTSDASR